MPQTNCPKCGTQVNMPESVEALRVRCPACRRFFEIPASMPPKPEAPVESEAEPTPQEEGRPTRGRSASIIAAVTYKCPGCKSTLESEDSLAGKSDVCPVCRQHVSVPIKTKRRGPVVVMLIAGGLVGIISVMVAVAVMYRNLEQPRPQVAEAPTPAITPSSQNKNRPVAIWAEIKKSGKDREFQDFVNRVDRILEAAEQSVQHGSLCYLVLKLDMVVPAVGGRVEAQCTEIRGMINAASEVSQKASQTFVMAGLMSSELGNPNKYDAEAERLDNQVRADLARITQLRNQLRAALAQ